MVKTLLPLHMTGALRPEVAQQVDEHLAVCAACRMVAAELKANQTDIQPESTPPPSPTPAPQLLQPQRPLDTYRRHASLAKVRDEATATPVREADIQAQPRVEQEPSPRPMTPPKQRHVNPKAPRQVADQDKAEHPGWRAYRDARRGAASSRSPKAMAQILFTILMVILALVMGMAWRGSSLRLEAYQRETTAGAIAELQADLRRIKEQLQSPQAPVALPPLSKETLAMGLLLQADPLQQESYLPLVEAYTQVQTALTLWRAEQNSAPAVIVTGFATEANKAVDELIQALEPLKQSSPPTADQRAAIKQRAIRLQGLAVSYVDEGNVPGQLPDAQISEQAAIAAAAVLLPEGAAPVKPAAVRRYQRRQGTDLWDVSFTHNLQKWQIQVSAVSGQVLGMTLPVPTKGDQVSVEQAEQTARAYLTERTEADRFVLFDRQERDGQVFFAVHRVIAGLRYFSDPLNVAVARYGGSITSYQRLQPTAAWAKLPVYQLTAEQAREQAETWAAGQKASVPADEGSLGVALHPSRVERLVWGFTVSEPGVFIYVDAQNGEVWKSN